MTTSPLLYITDGTTQISLLDPIGFMLFDWTPALPEPKSGGVWADSPIAEGRKLAYRQLGNVIDTFELKVRGASQDDAIRRLQELRRLLEKAVQYWTSDAQNEPVYLVAKAPNETNTRYAIIMDYRTPKDDNPFAMPFFSCKPLVDEFILTLEHGIWQDQVPGNSECVEISGEPAAGGLLVDTTAAPTTGTDDCSLKLDLTSMTYTIYLTETGLYLGQDLPNNAQYSSGVRFTGVAIPNGATILSAKIDLVVLDTAKLCNINIYGNDVDDAATFSTAANYTGRVLTTAFVPWTINYDFGFGGGVGETVSTPDISTIIQEIVNRGGWASGNDIAILMNYSSGDSDSLQAFAAYEAWGYDAPILVVVYTVSSASVDYGMEATCDPESVFIGNKHSRATLTNILNYDQSAGTYTEQLGDATPYDILPPGPAVQDAVYFGSTIGPFNNLVFDLSRTIRGITGMTWQYWNGAWTALTVTDYTYDTVELNVLGINSVHWVQPSDWVTTAVNGITAFWVRLYVDAIGALLLSAQQDNRDVYTCILPYVELVAEQVEGDIPALVRIKMTNKSDASGGSPDLRANRFIIGTRSLSRGEFYTPYLNVSDEQNPAGVTVTLGANTVYSNSAPSVTGRLATYTSPAAVGTTTEVTLTLDENISREYIGRFRVFLRYEYDTGAADAVSLRLVTTPGGSGLVQYSEYVFPQVNTAWQVADFGIVNIQPRSPLDNYGAITFSVEITRDTNGRIVFLHDLILMPVDEWSTDAIDKSGLAVRTGAVGYGDRLDIDSVTYPRQIDQAIMRDVSSGYIIGYYQNLQPGPALLQANRDQRIWFFCISYESGTELSSWISVSHSVTVDKVQRYLSARGAR